MAQKKRVYKVYVLKLGQYVASHVADSAFCEKKIGWGIWIQFFPKVEGIWTKQSSKDQMPGGLPGGESKFEASN